MEKKKTNKPSAVAARDRIRKGIDTLATFKDKIKSSYYLDIKSEEMIMGLYLKRLHEGERPRKSQLVDEAIKLLYDTEMGKK